MKNYLRADKLESFDEIHKKICVNLIEKCKERTNMTYGQAQKIINMAFKYLYCCKHDSEMEERFKACHMPLDSFSLEWFKRKFKEKFFSNPDSYSENNRELPENLFTKKGEKKLKAESIGSWSSMQTWEEDCKKQEYPYEFYAHVIKQYCKENSITPYIIVIDGNDVCSCNPHPTMFQHIFLISNIRHVYRFHIFFIYR